MYDVNYYIKLTMTIIILFVGCLMVVIPMVNLINDEHLMRRWRAPQHDALLQVSIIVVGVCVVICGIGLLEGLRIS